jgi:hypothetical protein
MQETPADPQEILAERDRAIAEINGYVDLTQEAKDRRINEVREWAQREYAHSRELEKRQREERLASTKRAVFSVPTGNMASEAEAATIHAAFRAAFSDVKAATQGPRSPQEAEQTLTEILDQAERTGNALLARAVYHRAIDLGVQKVVDRYLEGRPKEAKAWQRYTEAAAKVNPSFEELFTLGWTEQQLKGSSPS